MSKNKKGITLTSLAIAIAVMIILAGAITVTTIDIIERANMQQIVSNMILIQTKVKIIMEQASFSEDANTYEGRRLKDVANKAQIAGDALSAQEQEIDTYYVYDKTTLQKIGLDAIKLEGTQVYIVNYANAEIIYPEGIKNSNGEIVYKLSDMM